MIYAQLQAGKPSASGLSESALRARQGSALSSGGDSRSDSRPVSERGGTSVSGSVVSSGGGDGKAIGFGKDTYIDIEAIVQRRERERIKGRFAREARYAKRWQELKQIAQEMTQAEQNQKAAAAQAAAAR